LTLQWAEVRTLLDLRLVFVVLTLPAFVIFFTGRVNTTNERR
jgi:hypothetical protein